MHYPCQRDELGDLRLGEHRDGPDHHLRPHHPGLVHQNSFAMEGPALHGLVCKYKVGAHCSERNWEIGKLDNSSTITGSVVF